MACEPACLVTAPVFTFGGCGLLDAIRSGYVKNFVALRCDSTVPDITDSVAIAAQLVAGTMFVSPILTGEVPFPATGDPITENCEAEQPTSRTYSFNFTSYRVDNTSLTDFQTWNVLSGSLTTWTLAPVTCDNLLIVPQSFSTDGDFFSMRGVISNTLPNTNAMTYEGQLLFKYSELLNGVQLTQAIVDALGLGGAGTIVT